MSPKKKRSKSAFGIFLIDQWQSEKGQTEKKKKKKRTHHNSILIIKLDIAYEPQIFLIFFNN
jgi:hypothetical protein